MLETFTFLLLSVRFVSTLPWAWLLINTLKPAFTSTFLKLIFVNNYGELLTGMRTFLCEPDRHNAFWGASTYQVSSTWELLIWLSWVNIFSKICINLLFLKNFLYNLPLCKFITFPLIKNILNSLIILLYSLFIYLFIFVLCVCIYLFICVCMCMCMYVCVFLWALSQFLHSTM